MKAFKGCVNPNCVDCKRRVHYKGNDEFCVHCGKPLQYVCAKCWKQLDTDTFRLCEGCQIERDEKIAKGKDAVINGAKQVAQCAVAVVPVAVGVAKKVGIDKDKVVNVAADVVKVALKK